MKEISMPALIIKILGLVLIVAGLPDIPYLCYGIICAIQTSGQEQAAFKCIGLNIPSLFYILVGALFFFASRTMAGRLILKKEESLSPLTTESFQTVVYSAIGLYIAMRAIPAISSELAGRVFTRMNGHHPLSLRMNPWDACQFIGAAVQFVFGVGLFLGAKGVAGFRNRMRQVGAQ